VLNWSVAVAELICGKYAKRIDRNATR